MGVASKKKKKSRWVLFSLQFVREQRTEIKGEAQGAAQRSVVERDGEKKKKKQTFFFSC